MTSHFARDTLEVILKVLHLELIKLMIMLDVKENWRLLATLTGDTEGGQAGGTEGRRRAGLSATQVCFLPQRHQPHVPLSVTGEDHPVSGCAIMLLLLLF